MRTLWLQLDVNGQHIIDYEMFWHWPVTQLSDQISGPFEHPGADPSLVGMDNMPDSGSFWILAVGCRPQSVGYSIYDGGASGAPLRVGFTLKDNPPNATIRIQWDDLEKGNRLPDGDVIRHIPQGDGMSLHTAPSVTWWKKADIWNSSYGTLFSAETHDKMHDAGLVPGGLPMSWAGAARLTLWKAKFLGFPTPMYWVILDHTDIAGQISWEKD